MKRWLDSTKRGTQSGTQRVLNVGPNELREEKIYENQWSG
jgi:hypothetical protein